MARQFVTVAALVAIALAIAIPRDVVAQGGRGGGFRGAGPGGPGAIGGGPFGGGGMLGLIMRPEVQDELQLVDEQREKVVGAANDMRQRLGEELRDMFSQMGNLSDEERQERFEEIRTRVESLNKDLEARLKKELLPHQYERLKQIDVQTRIQQRGANALTSGELSETLGLTDEQRQKLEARAAEVQQELQEKIAQLRIEARNKMLDVLTPEQRAKLESLMGDSFAMPEGGFGFGGFQGRGGFGRGGDRGSGGDRR